MKRFVPRYLDPATRLGEVLFGLIMVLTFTLAAGFSVPQDQTGVRELLLAAIGCNLAWGIIDAVMYVMNGLTLRAGKIRLVNAVQTAVDSETALALVQAEVQPELQELLRPEDAQAMSQTVARHLARAPAAENRITREDIYGALACFGLVFVSSFPPALPFLFFSQPRFALRVSNCLLIVLLFVVGYKWARYTGTNAIATGSVMVAIGLALVGIAILLGG